MTKFIIRAKNRYAELTMDASKYMENNAPSANSLEFLMCTIQEFFAELWGNGNVAVYIDGQIDQNSVEKIIHFLEISDGTVH